MVNFLGVKLFLGVMSYVFFVFFWFLMFVFFTTGGIFRFPRHVRPPIRVSSAASDFERSLLRPPFLYCDN